MKRLVLLVVMLFAFVPLGFAGNHGPGSHHSSHSTSGHISKKSHASGSHDGTYTRETLKNSPIHRRSG